MYRVEIIVNGGVSSFHTVPTFRGALVTAQRLFRVHLSHGAEPEARVHDAATGSEVAQLRSSLVSLELDSDA